MVVTASYLPSVKSRTCPSAVKSGQAFLQISREAFSGLITVRRLLRKKLEDDGGNLRRQIGCSFFGRGRRADHVAVYPFLHSGCKKRQGAGEQLVERDAERIEIASAIDRTVHPTGLFRRDIG
jgi:hypothetical protein